MNCSFICIHLAWRVTLYDSTAILFIDKNFELSKKMGENGVGKVLIIDGAKFMRTTLASIFEKHDFTVVGMAEDGQEGVELYKSTTPDIVTLDITMPVMDGLQALEQIMQFDPNANVIMCSAMGQQKLVVEAIELGAKDFIVKPFDEKRVMETVNNILKNKQNS